MGTISSFSLYFGKFSGSNETTGRKDKKVLVVVVARVGYSPHSGTSVLS